MEEKQKQKRIDFQFALPDDKVESERLETDRETSTPTSVSTRRTSSAALFSRDGQMLQRENIVTPAERTRKSIHGHRRHYY